MALTMFSLKTLLLSQVASASTLNLAIINDIHLDPDASGTSIALCTHLPFCHSDLSVYTSESTPKLLDQVISQIDSTKYSSLLINGDFIKHGVALKDPTGDWKTAWKEVKSIMGQALAQIRPKFNNVFPVIGNNDVAIHD